MKKTVMALGFLLALPVAAQDVEVGVFAGRQAYASAHTDVVPGGTLQVEADTKTVWGLRLGYSLVDLGPALFQVTAGYQPETSARLKGSLGGAPIGEGDLKESHWSAGVMFNFKAVVAVGLGVEFRSESLKETTDSTTYNRPWARLTLGYAFPTPGVKPFMGLEADFPLVSKSNEFGSTADLLKSLAPKNQIGIYAGLRF